MNEEVMGLMYCRCQLGVQSIKRYTVNTVVSIINSAFFFFYVFFFMSASGTVNKCFSTREILLFCHRNAALVGLSGLPGAVVSFDLATES